MQVTSMHFKARAGEKLADVKLRRSATARWAA
jgi:hypothetical protein